MFLVTLQIEHFTKWGETPRHRLTKYSGKRPGNQYEPMEFESIEHVLHVEHQHKQHQMIDTHTHILQTFVKHLSTSLPNCKCICTVFYVHLKRFSIEARVIRIIFVWWSCDCLTPMRVVHSPSVLSSPNFAQGTIKTLPGPGQMRLRSVHRLIIWRDTVSNNISRLTMKAI